MKKIIATITLMFFLSANTSFAFVPVAIPPALYLASALLHAAAAAGVYYKLHNNRSHVVDPLSGKVIHPADVVWIEAGQIPSVQSKDINASLPYDKIKHKADANPNDYPSIKSALYQPEYFPLDKDSSVGGNYINPANGENNKITQITIKNAAYYCQGPGWAAPPPPVYATNSFDFYYQNGSCAGGDGTLWGRLAGVFNGDQQPPNNVLYTPQQFATNISNADGTLKSAYDAEIEKMINDPDYVPVFTDATTGLPDAMPANAMTPAQVEAYNTKGASQAAADEAKQAAAQSAAAAAAAANGAATAATNAYTASGGNPLTGEGGDPALYQKMRDAQAAAAAAQAEADKYLADQAQADADELNQTGAYPDSDLAGAGGLGATIVGRFKQLGSNIAGRAPFSYLTGVQAAISSLYAPAVAPAFDLPLGPFSTSPLHISMAWADPLAALTRFFSWLTFTLGAIWSFKGYWHRS